VVYLQVRSDFPDPLRVDEVIVTYVPFVPPMMTGLGVTSPTVGAAAYAHGGQSATKAQGSFDCIPLPECFSENEEGRGIVLVPGEQVLPLSFKPPSCSEYVLGEVVIRMGGVVFTESVVSDVNKLHPFFSSNVLVLVSPPTEALSLRPFAPAFSPVDQVDTVGIRIDAEPGDVVESLFVRVWSKPDGYADTTDVAGTAEPLRVFGAVLELALPGRWAIGGFATDGCNSSLSVDLKHDGILINKFPVATGANVIVPFKALSATLTTSEAWNDSMRQKYQITFLVEGTVVRNSCTIDFKSTASCSTVIGTGLSFQQFPTELFGEDYFCQCVVTNISPVPWTLLPFAVAQTSTSPASPAMRRFILAAGEEESGPPLLNKEGVLLQPMDSYYAGIHLALAKEEVVTSEQPSPPGAKKKNRSFTATVPAIAPDTSYAKVVAQPPTSATEIVAGALPLEIVFPARRACGTVLQEEEAGSGGDTAWIAQTLDYYDKTVFETHVSVQKPFSGELSGGAAERACSSLDCRVSVEVDRSAKGHVTVGEPVTCTYTLDVIYPTSSLLAVAWQQSQQLSLGLSSREEGNWMAIGKTHRQFSCSPAVRPLQMLHVCVYTCDVLYFTCRISRFRYRCS
jgi:hypothetical protein